MINPCTFDEANIVLIAMKKRVMPFSILVPLSFTERRPEGILVGYTQIRPLIANRIGHFRREGRTDYRGYSLDITVFPNDLSFSEFSISDHRLVYEYQENIISKCVGRFKPIVWALGYPVLLRALFWKFLKGGALVHYYEPQQEDPLFAVIDRPEEGMATPYTTRFIRPGECACKN